MAKVTKKLQVSVPKTLAEQYGIQPGDDLEWQAAGDVLRVIPPDKCAPRYSLNERLALFDAATQRQQERDGQHQPPEAAERGWTRDQLYERGHSPD